MRNKGLAGTLVAVAVWLLTASTASAAWEAGREVDYQGAGAGAVGNYLGVTDGANGLSSAFFEQAVGSANRFYAIRRGAGASAWGTLAAIAFPSPSPGLDTPVSAAADASGNALGLTEQISGGVPAVYGSPWPASEAAPGAYATTMSTPVAQGGVTDPQVAFDGSGNGYAVAGEGQGASADEPILLSLYSPSAQAWSKPAPITVRIPTAADCTNSEITTKGEICGQEPKLAVSPDGAVVVVYLVSVPGTLPSSTQEELFGVRAAAGAVAGSGGAAAFDSAQQISSASNQVPVSSAPGSGSANYPPNYDVAIDSAGTATIVDAEGPSPLNTRVMATRWTAGSQTPETARAISGAPPPTGTEPPASEPRVVSDSAGDVTAIWTESSQSSAPPADALLAAEIVNGSWTQPETVASVDSPSNPQGYQVNTPPFWLAEDAAGTAYAVWTDSGSLQDAIRQPGKAWSAVDTISGISGAVAGTERVTTGLSGQADAVVLASNGSRNALYAARFTSPVPPPSPSAPPPTPGPPASGAPRPATKTVTVPKRSACYARPTSRIFRGRTRRTKRAIVIVGRASEHRCADVTAAIAAKNRVVKVLISIYHPAPGGRCRFLTRLGKITRPLPCRRPIVFFARGTTNWKLVLRIRIPPGIYLVRSDAVDGFARHQGRSAASVQKIVVRAKRRRKARR